MKKIPILLLFVLPASLICLSCGGGTPSATRTSGLPYRAFISNSVSSGTSSAGVYVVNALSDVRPGVAPISAGNNPGMLVLTPNLALTLVFSGIGTQASDNQFTVINNASESAVGHVSLPGLTESFVVAPDSSTAYVALPTATVVGQPPGLVEAISLNNGAFVGQVNISSTVQNIYFCVGAASAESFQEHDARQILRQMEIASPPGTVDVHRTRVALEELANGFWVLCRHGHQISVTSLAVGAHTHIVSARLAKVRSVVSPGYFARPER